ncbi:glutathione S-transferase family protein [Epibacterium sp. Ofav1-8]|uniref:glutathione S-transferase family protein n=1 Tax=Epibacterium sp. Ofav1-8 TaxID=2917735 RepID=UPI001EF5326A|nr:glutathione S-transferase family protein [Epibacterium sp. Ofav1-8]MCG7625524.1 glutathione S-transferase family protein [Epibacterium sp. Ofav1-8]
MYKVIGKPMTRTFRVLWALEELEQPYELEDAAPQSAEIRAYNPSGKVPALVVDGTTVTDSVAIITYLADKHGALTAPAGTLARARQDAITNMLNDEMDALLWMAARHSFALPEEQRVPAIKDSLRWEFARSVSRVEARLTDEFIAGDSFSIADILLTHCLNWARGAKFEVESDALLAYGKRMRARPAFQRVAALSK